MLGMVRDQVGNGIRNMIAANGASFATGGLIEAHSGEYVLKKAAVNALGVGNVDQMNQSGQFPGGKSGDTYNSNVTVASGAIIVHADASARPEDIAKEVLKQLKRKSQDGEYVISQAGVRA